MASTARRQQPIEDEPLKDLAANDNVEDFKILKVSGENKAKIESGKIKLEINSPEILGEASKAANDNVEIPKEKISSPENKPASEQVASQPKTESEETKKSDEQQPTPAQQPNEQQQEQPNGQELKQNDAKNQTGLPEKKPDEPAKTTEPTEGQQPDGQTQEQKPVDQIPPTQQPQNTEQTPNNTNEINPAEQTPNPTQTQNPDNKEPQKLSPNDDLANTGPHPTGEKVPATVTPANQSAAASSLAASKTLGAKIGDNIANKFDKGVKSIKDAPKNYKDKLTNRFSNDTLRKIRLIKDRRKLQSDLDKLENKVNDVKSSLAMKILQWWLPTIYNMITGFSMGISKKLANASEATQEKIFSKALTTLKTVKSMLETVQASTSLTMALVNTGKLIAAGLELFVVPGILLMIISPFVVLILWMINFLIIPDKLTAAVKKIEKKINEIIKESEETFEPIRKRVQIRKKIQVINRLLAATKDNRKEHYNQPESSNSQPTA